MMIKSKRKQSKYDRALRLSEGRCPIHGCGMGQTGLEYVKMPCGHIIANRSTTKCDRRNCEIKAYFDDKNGIYEIFNEFKDVMRGE